jgi:hypothetical protein
MQLSSRYKVFQDVMACEKDKTEAEERGGGEKKTYASPFPIPHSRLGHPIV